MSEQEPNTLDDIIMDMANIPYSELMNLVYRHESVNRVFNEHKKEIFREKTKSNYPCIGTAEEIFLIVDRSRDAYDNVCRRKYIRDLPKWEDAKTYFRRSMNDIINATTSSSSLELFVTNMERIPFVMSVFTNFYELNKLRRITELELWNDVIYMLCLFSTVYTATRSQFTRSYLENKVDEFFSSRGVGGELLKIAENKMGINVREWEEKAGQILNAEFRLSTSSNINVLGRDISPGSIFSTFRARVNQEEIEE